MDRTSRFRGACRLLAALFIIIACARLLTSLAPLFDPLLSTAYLECDPCGVHTDPVLLLEPESERRDAWRTVGAEQRILELIEQPRVRLMLLAAQLVRAVPFFMLFLSLAWALRSLASGGFNLGAIRWLRRATLAAVLWTVLLPVSQSIRWTAFSPVTSGSDAIVVAVNVAELIWPALLAAAVWICVRALEEALIMRKDLEDYI